jgi:hypothetical protein
MTCQYPKSQALIFRWGGCINGLSSEVLFRSGSLAGRDFYPDFHQMAINPFISINLASDSGGGDNKN